MSSFDSSATDSSAAHASLPFLYGTAWKKERTTELVVQAVKSGFRGIDTACQPKHYREDLVGAAVQQLIAEGVVTRDQLWLQTKYTPLTGQDKNNVPYDAGAPLAAQVEQSIARSLLNLGTHRIDSLVLHSPLAKLEEMMEVWGVFEAAVDAGTVTQLGISNCYSIELFTYLYTQARIKPAVLQNRFYAESGHDVALRAFCLEHGIAYQTFWTLTNKAALASEPVRAAAARLGGATPEQVLFRWLIQAGHQPLTGTTSAEHMAQDLAAVGLVLTPPEMAAIGALFSGGRSP